MRNTLEQLDIITPPFRKLTLYIIQKMRWERDQEEQSVIRVSSLWKNAWRFLRLHPADSSQNPRGWDFPNEAAETELRQLRIPGKEDT